MDNTDEPNPHDVNRYRGLALQTPGSIQSVVQILSDQLIERITRGGSRANVLAEMDQIKQDMGYAQAPALERLLIEHVLATRTRVIDIENRYNSIKNTTLDTSPMEEYFDSLLTSAHARYLKAIESLARVRRLAVRTPNFQINIAESGARQTNSLDPGSA